MEEYTKQNRQLSNSLEHYKVEEQESKDQLGEDAKEMERITNRQSVLVKRVRPIYSPFIYSYPIIADFCSRYRTIIIVTCIMKDACNL